MCYEGNFLTNSKSFLFCHLLNEVHPDPGYYAVVQPACPYPIKSLSFLPFSICFFHNISPFSIHCHLLITYVCLSSAFLCWNTSSTVAGIVVCLVYWYSQCADQPLLCKRSSGNICETYWMSIWLTPHDTLVLIGYVLYLFQFNRRKQSSGTSLWCCILGTS